MIADDDVGVPAAVFGVERCVGVAGGELPSMERAEGLSRPLLMPAAPNGLGSGLDTTLISTSASEEDISHKLANAQRTVTKLSQYILEYSIDSSQVDFSVWCLLFAV